MYISSVSKGFYLAKSLLTISSFTLLSRFFGFIRDVTIATIFGASLESDAFFIAFKIPNFLRMIFSEGIFSQIFIPILIKYRIQNKKEEAKIFLSHIMGLVIFLSILLTLFGTIFAPWITSIIAPGIKNIKEKTQLTILLLKIIFPYIFFISLSSLMGNVLNAWENFTIPSISPIFLNLSMIGFSIFLSSFFHPPISALAWSILFSGIFQTIYQIPFLKRIDMLVIPRIKWINFKLQISKKFKKTWPFFLSYLVIQFSSIFSTIFSSFLDSGSVTWIYYSDRLIDFPSGILGTALGIVLLPMLSNSLRKKENFWYLFQLNWSIRFCFIFGLPSSIIFYIFSKPLIISLFQYRNFSNFDTLMTQRSVVSCAGSITGILLTKVFISAFYANQDIKTPTKVITLTTFLTQIMNIFFIPLFKHVSFSISSEISSYINAISLFILLKKKNFFVPIIEWRIFFIRLICSSFCMLVSLIFFYIKIKNWSQGDIFIRLFRVTIIIVSSVSIYFFSLWIFGFRFRDLFIFKSPK